MSNDVFLRAYDDELVITHRYFRNNPTTWLNFSQTHDFAIPRGHDSEMYLRQVIVTGRWGHQVSLNSIPRVGSVSGHLKFDHPIAYGITQKSVSEYVPFKDTSIYDPPIPIGRIDLIELESHFDIQEPTLMTATGFNDVDYIEVDYMVLLLLKHHGN